MDTEQMPADVVSNYYESKAAHTMYIGEVINIVCGGPCTASKTQGE